MKRRLIGLGVLLALLSNSAAAQFPGERRSAPHDSSHPLTAQQIVFSPDGRHVAVAYFRGAMNRPGTDWDAKVATWDLQTSVRTILDDACHPVALSNEQLLAGRYTRDFFQPRSTLSLYDLGETEPARTLKLKQPEPEHDRDRPLWRQPLAAAFDPQGRVISLDSSGQLLLWPIEPGEPAVLDDITPLFEPHSPVRIRRDAALAAASNGEHILAVFRGHYGNPVSIQWSLRDGRAQRRSHHRDGDAIAHVSALHWIAENNERLLRNNTPFLHPQPHLRRSEPWTIRDVVYSPDLNTMALAIGRVVVLRRADGRPAHRFPDGGGTMAFGPDGNTLAIADWWGIVRIWDVNSGQLLHVLRLDEADPMTVRVAAIQASSEFGQPQANRQKLTRLVQQAAGEGAQIVVLPETAVTGYLTTDIRQTWHLPGWPITHGLIGVDPADVAETVPGDSTHHFAALARSLGIYITVPILEVDRRTGRYYNTLVLVDPYGETALHYRKLNPWPWAERSWATPGNLGNPVLDTPYGRLGLLICYDIHRQARVMADLQVDLLLYSIAWVEDAGSDWFEKQLPEIARRSNMAIIAANWSVTEPVGWHGHGQSRIIDRDGNILAKATDASGEQIILVDLPLPIP